MQRTNAHQEGPPPSMPGCPWRRAAPRPVCLARCTVAGSDSSKSFLRGEKAERNQQLTRVNTFQATRANVEDARLWSILFVRHRRHRSQAKCPPAMDDRRGLRRGQERSTAKDAMVFAKQTMRCKEHMEPTSFADWRSPCLPSIGSQAGTSLSQEWERTLPPAEFRQPVRAGRNAKETTCADVCTITNYLGIGL